MRNSLEEEYVSTFSNRIEQEYQLHPVIFNIKLGLLSLLGYLLIFSYCFIPALIGAFLCIAVLSLVNGSSVELLLESFNFAIFIILFSILFHSNPFKKLYQIEGYELTAQEFPVLFAEFDQLSQKRKAPRIHTIVLDHSRNAGVTRMPRFTFLGWNKNTLSLGSPEPSKTG